MLDRMLAFLMRPRVARLRRWSFLVALPLAVVGVLHAGPPGGVAVAVAAARLALSAAVAVWAWRLGGERGDAVRDLLMHPRARALMRAELDVLLTPLRLLTRRRPAPAALRYHRGDERLPIALAGAVAFSAEAAVEHLLVPYGWIAVQVVLAAVHAYGLLWLLAWGAGPRAWPHAVRAGTLVLRNGPLYRAEVPLAAVASVRAARRRVGAGGLVLAEDVAALPSRGRVDVRIELSAPVRVHRPLREPVAVRALEVASDDPAGLVAAIGVGGLDAPAAPSVPAVGGLALAALARELAHPA